MRRDCLDYLANRVGQDPQECRDSRAMKDYQVYPGEMGLKVSHHYLGYLVREEMLVCRVPLEYLEERVPREVLDLLE